MESFKFQAQQSRSLRHRIADDIRKAIFSGLIKPGDRLREQEIAEQMNVSRGPVREALSVLERDGLVISFPYKETVVVELSPQEISDVLIPIRFTLEEFAMKETIPHLSNSDFDYLESLIQSMIICAHNGDLAGLVDLDIRFHRHFIESSPYSTVSSLWESIDMRIRLYFLNNGKHYETLTHLVEEHRVLLNEIKTKELDRILSELHRHICEVNVYSFDDALNGGN